MSCVYENKVFRKQWILVKYRLSRLAILLCTGKLLFVLKYKINILMIYSCVRLTSAKSLLNASWDDFWKENIVFGDVCQVLLMKSNPFVFFASGSIPSVSVIMLLQLYFLTVSFMLDERRLLMCYRPCVS